MAGLLFERKQQLISVSCNLWFFSEVAQTTLADCIPICAYIMAKTELLENELISTMTQLRHVMELCVRKDQKLI